MGLAGLLGAVELKSRWSVCLWLFVPPERSVLFLSFLGLHRLLWRFREILPPVELMPPLALTRCRPVVSDPTAARGPHRSGTTVASRLLLRPRSSWSPILLSSVTCHPFLLLSLPPQPLYRPGSCGSPSRRLSIRCVHSTHQPHNRDDSDAPEINKPAPLHCALARCMWSSCFNSVTPDLGNWSAPAPAGVPLTPQS